MSRLVELVFAQADVVVIDLVDKRAIIQVVA